MSETKVQRNYKDSFFRMLFKDKENLLSLYNALNGTDYTDVGRLADLLQKLMDAGRSEDVNRAISDPEYRKQLYLENI